MKSNAEVAPWSERSWTRSPQCSPWTYVREIAHLGDIVVGTRRITILIECAIATVGGGDRRVRDVCIPANGHTVIPQA